MRLSAVSSVEDLWIFTYAPRERNQGRFGSLLVHALALTVITSGFYQAPWSFVQLNSEYLQGLRSYHLSGQPIPVLNLSHGRVFVLFIWSGSPLLWLVSIAGCPFLLHLWEGSGPGFSISCSSAVWGLQWDPPLPSLSLDEPAQLSQPRASEHIMFHICPTLYVRRLATFREVKHLQKTF